MEVYYSEVNSGLEQAIKDRNMARIQHFVNRGGSLEVGLAKSAELRNDMLFKYFTELMMST